MTVNYYTIIFTLVNFIVLVLLLKKFLYNPVLNMIQAREKSINNSINDAKQKLEQAEILKKQYEVNMQNAKEDAKKIVDEGRKVAKLEGDNIINNATEKAKSIKDRADKDIEFETNKARRELLNEVTEISTLVAQKIIEKEVKDVQSDYIDKAISEIGAVSWEK